MSKRCRVVCDTESGLLGCELELPDAATIAEALAAARAQLGAIADWDAAPTGIFGEPQARGYVPAEGDRIELYRGLKIDPRARRRAHVAASAGVKRGARPRRD